jgi:predicted RNase H-like HicB family nuclease
MELIANIHREDGGYWAEVSELPGCFASGDTLDELFDSLRDGVHLYLEDEDGGSINKAFRLKAAVLSDSAPG